MPAPDQTPQDQNIEDLTLDELRPLVVRAMLVHVPFDGWSRASVEKAAADIGVNPALAGLLFPKGTRQMLAHFTRIANADMWAALDNPSFHSLKVREKITIAIKTRLQQAAPHKEARRRAIAFLASPQNAVLAARLNWRTADSIWRLAGDTATDFNHYSKRAIAGSVYVATLMVWLADDSPESADSFAFLDRRIDDVMRIEKLKAKLKGGKKPGQGLLQKLGHWRYPAPDAS